MLAIFAAIFTGLGWGALGSPEPTCNDDGLHRLRAMTQAYTAFYTAALCVCVACVALTFSEKYQDAAEHACAVLVFVVGVCGGLAFLVMGVNALNKAYDCTPSMYYMCCMFVMSAFVMYPVVSMMIITCMVYCT